MHYNHPNIDVDEEQYGLKALQREDGGCEVLMRKVRNLPRSPARDCFVCCGAADIRESESAAHTGVIGKRVGCIRINKGGTAEFSVPGRERKPGVLYNFRYILAQCRGCGL